MAHRTLCRVSRGAEQFFRTSQELAKVFVKVTRACKKKGPLSRNEVFICCFGYAESRAAFSKVKLVTDETAEQWRQSWARDPFGFHPTNSFLCWLLVSDADEENFSV